MLLSAARRLEPLDSRLARETYVDAWGAAFVGGRLAADDLAEISRAVRALPRSSHPGPMELMLDGLALLITDGVPAAAPTLKEAVRLFAGDTVAAADRLRWNYMTLFPVTLLWDADGYRAILARQLQLARNAGVLDTLPYALESAAMLAAFSGDLPETASVLAESSAVCEAIGIPMPVYTTLLLACLRGRQAEAVPLIDATINAAGAGGQGFELVVARWVAAVLYNGLGRYDEAREAARQAAGDPFGFHVSLWALPELIEAAARAGDLPMAGDALQRLADSTQAGGNDWGWGSRRAHARW